MKSLYRILFYLFKGLFDLTHGINQIFDKWISANRALKKKIQKSTNSE